MEGERAQLRLIERETERQRVKEHALHLAVQLAPYLAQLRLRENLCECEWVSE